MRLKVFCIYFFNEVINLNTKMGAVAQLGERLDGIQKVVGSIRPAPPLGEKHEK